MSIAFHPSHHAGSLLKSFNGPFVANLIPHGGVTADFAEFAIDYNQSPAPSSTKPRFVPPFTGGKPGDLRGFISSFDALSTQQIDCGVPGQQGWIDDGYGICATDYQGLGSPGQHQYVVNRTQTRDAFYLVHTAHA